MQVDVLLGLQWGDEGKGKIVDVLCPEYDLIARFQGGPNAGHTLEFDNKKFVLNTIPSGKSIFHGYQKNEILAKQLISKGYYLSFGKAVLNGSMDKVLTETPVDRIFLETDHAPVSIDEIYAYVAG
ncbi:hypothetical protein FQR65_LT17848 [Abscondita terminalis]|nr:hypothetical protein FQR65_LT17848 [Abscondita terminalis]